MSLGCRERFLVISTNWPELDSWCWVRPAKGRRILARYRAVLYVGEPLDATIGRRGTSGLWIFGCPKNLGQDEQEGLRCRYSWMVRASARWRARSLLATRFSMDGMGFFLRGRYELGSIHYDCSVALVRGEDMDGVVRRYVTNLNPYCDDIVKVYFNGRPIIYWRVETNARYQTPMKCKYVFAIVRYNALNCYQVLQWVGFVGWWNSCVGW